MSGFTKIVEFSNFGEEWSGYDQARDWCDQQGFSYGQMQRQAPTAIFADNSYVSKWRNLTKKDLQEMWGYIDCPDKRHGKAIIYKKGFCDE